MKEQREYRFVIDAYRPDTLPMARLAEYMGELARLLGRLDQVHFVRLEEGSTALVQRVEPRLRPTSRNDSTPSDRTTSPMMQPRRSRPSTATWLTTMPRASCKKAKAPKCSGFPAARHRHR